MSRLVKIGISKLQIEMFIGISEEERSKKQKIVIDIECSIANLSDNIEDTLNYCIFESICKELAIDKKYDLLEVFASDILSKLSKIKSIKFIKLKVNKPSAIKNAKEAYVLVEEAL